MKRLAVAVLALTLFFGWAVSSQATTWHGEPAYVLHNHRAVCRINYYRETIRVKGKREVGCVYRVPVIAITAPPVSITQTPAPVIQNPVGNTAPATTVPAPTTTVAPTTTTTVTTTTTPATTTTTTQPLQIVNIPTITTCNVAVSTCTFLSNGDNTINGSAQVTANSTVLHSAGTVTFTDANGVVLCVATLADQASATCSAAYSGGSIVAVPVVASYSGYSVVTGNTEDNYQPSTGVGIHSN